LVLGCRPDGRTMLTLAGRYAGRAFGAIGHGDVVGHADARAHFRLDKKWSAAPGLETLSNRQYYLFHPFPGPPSPAS
jgi:iron complex outermembrane receptor protein